MATRLERLMSARPVGKGSLEAIFLRNLKLQDFGAGVLDSPYKKSQLVHVCISRTSRAVSQVPLLRYQLGGREGDIAEPVASSDPWQQLLLLPNQLQNAFKFIESLLSWYLLEGNVFCIPFPPGARVPAALYLVPKVCVDAKLHEDTNQLLGWIYKPRGSAQVSDALGQYALSPNQVIPFTTFNPDDPIFGQAPLEAGEVAIRTDYKAEIFNERFFDNAGVPAGAITAPEKAHLSSAQWKRLKAEIESRHSGYQKAHKFMWLEKGLKFEAMSLAHKDMMFPDLKKMSREQIMQIYGTPKAALSVTEDLNYATAKEQKQGWWEDTLIPLCKMIAFGFTHALLGQQQAMALSRHWIWNESPALQKVVTKGRFLQGLGNTFFDFDLANVPALKEDLADKILSAQRLGRLGFTADEINQRLELGFDEAPWRKVWWKDAGSVPVGEDTDLDQFLPQPEGPAPVKPEEELPPEEEELEDEDELEDELEDEDEDEDLGSAGKDIWEEEGAKCWKRLVTGSIPLEDKFKNKMRRVFWEVRHVCLQHILDSGDPVALELEDFREIREGMMKWAPKFYQDSIELGIISLLEDAKDLLGLEKLTMTVGEKKKEDDDQLQTPEEVVIDLDLIMEENPVIIEYVRDKVSKITGMESGPLATLKKQIHQQLSEGMASGESIAQLADRVKYIHKMATTRAKTIARTEVIGASNKGRSEALRYSGFKRKKWFTALDERVRQSHRDLGKEPGIPVEDRWRIPSGANVGATLAYPGDYTGPPGETINCRCIEIPLER